MEKPGIWQFKQKIPGIWEILKKNRKNLEFWTKIFKKPGIFNNFYMLSSKISNWHKKIYQADKIFCHHQKNFFLKTLLK